MFRDGRGMTVELAFLAALAGTHEHNAMCATSRVRLLAPLPF